jgi:hypothetical protein
MGSVRPTCRCAGGDLHGPYYYLFWRERGRLRKRYVRTAAAAAVRADCVQRREARRQMRRWLEECREKWRKLDGMIREHERLG